MVFVPPAYTARGEQSAAQPLCHWQRLRGGFPYTVYTLVYRPAGWLNFKEWRGLKTCPLRDAAASWEASWSVLHACCLWKRGGVCERLSNEVRGFLLNLSIKMNVKYTANLHIFRGRQRLWMLFIVSGLCG